jgi:hypothetical protein
VKLGTFFNSVIFAEGGKYVLYKTVITYIQLDSVLDYL